MSVVFLVQIVGFVGFCWLVVFQVLLAVGAPLGRLAWGGQNRVLPIKLRWASLISIAIAALGVTMLGQALELWALYPAFWLRIIAFCLAALFAVSLLGNALSKSRPERLHGVPLTLVLALSSLSVALTK